MADRAHDTHDTHDTGHDRTGDTDPNVGPISPNRTPMIIGLAFIALIVLAVLGYGIAEIVTYATK